MGKQATAVCNWTLNLRDPADDLTNKAALLEREGSFWLIITQKKKKKKKKKAQREKLESVNQESI